MKKLRQKSNESQDNFQKRKKSAEFNNKRISFGKVLWNSAIKGTFKKEKSTISLKAPKLIKNNSWKMKEQKIAKMHRQNEHI